MNIQIFGTSKCFDTKKAQRYFKERSVKFQMIDLKEKGMSRGEFDNVARALGGWEKMVNPNAKDKQTLALLEARPEIETGVEMPQVDVGGGLPVGGHGSCAVGLCLVCHLRNLSL